MKKPFCSPNDILEYYFLWNLNVPRGYFIDFIYFYFSLIFP